MKKINLAILWHMHQPPYLEPSCGQNLLPWAFLHGMKDYYDMGAVAARHPRMRMNFNFTPSLLEQISGYADYRIDDRTLAVMSKPPETMSEQELEYLFRTCFSTTDLMVERLPGFIRLRNLYRTAVAAGQAIPSLRPGEITDLTVLFLLAWCGPTMAAREPAASLMKKSGGFTAQDRTDLTRQARKHLASTRALYLDLVEQGIVELSTTPGTHPILPLLCSAEAAIEARPDVRMPPNRFGSPEEAKRQVDAGLDGFNEFFGFRPAGMWPAEGSVSPKAVSILKNAGVRWIATDEEILRKSGRGRAQDFRRPWTWDGVSIFFRDHHLSDQIGFVYSKRPAVAAVEDFLAQMAARAETATGPDDIVVLALDGENAWEYYPDGGFDFLDTLYGAIEKSSFINPVTFSDYIREFGPGKPLERLATGSWIDGNFDTWIGDPVKNRAWDYLASAARAVADADLTPDARKNVDRHLLRAEASDWFWWFGKGHSTIHEREFDFLFRRNLRAIYEDAQLAVPDYLDRPLGADVPAGPGKVPTAHVSPKITGRHDSYYKWVGAGECDYSHGSIHRLQPVVGKVRFGFDSNLLYIAAERFETAQKFLRPGLAVRLIFLSPRPMAVTVSIDKNQIITTSVSDPDGNSIECSEVTAAVDQIMELSIPLSLLTKKQKGEPAEINVSFYLRTAVDGIDEERFPWDSTIDFSWNPRTFEMERWFV